MRHFKAIQKNKHIFTFGDNDGRIMQPSLSKTPFSFEKVSKSDRCGEKGFAIFLQSLVLYYVQST